MVAVQAGTRYTCTFHGRAEEVSRVRHEIAGYLGRCPVADDIVFIASELAANAILHAQSRGSTFTVHCQLTPSTARIEIEDLGGPWRRRNPGDRPHGLDIIQALTGPDQWGTQPTDTGDAPSGPSSHGEHRHRPQRPSARRLVVEATYLP